MNTEAPNSDPVVFVDLDDCLIHTRCISSLACKPAGFVVLPCGDKGVPIHVSTLRPSALKMLADLRGVAPVKIITTGTEDYAQRANELFSLGFDPSDIISRDGFLVTIRGAYGSSSLFPTDVDQFPNSVLIDNHPFAGSDGEKVRVKMNFLGIGGDRFFQVREFNGDPDPRRFLGEWLSIVRSVSTILKTDLSLRQIPLPS